MSKAMAMEVSAQEGAIITRCREAGFVPRQLQVMLEGWHEITSLTRRRSYSYGCRDEKLKSAVAQAQRWAELEPGLDISHVEQLAAACRVPNFMEGVLVWPKPSRLGQKRGLWQRATDWPVWNCAMKRLLDIAREVDPHGFADRSGGKIGPRHLQLTEASQRLYAYLERQPGDLIVVVGQMGMLHEGVDPRTHAFDGTTPVRQFALDPLAVGSVIVTNPDCFYREGYIWITCAGAELVQKAPRDGREAWYELSWRWPHWDSFQGQPRYVHGWWKYPHEYHWLATAWV